MDPNATWKLITDESNTLDERAVAATDMLVWITQGGHLPITDSINGRTRNGQCVGNRNHVVEMCQHVIFKTLDRLDELENETTDREASIAESRLRHPSRI